jgi:flavodoxin
MKTPVVYDSFFGNTEKIAKTIGEAAGAEVIKINDMSAEKLKGTELLFTGSPTRGFKPTPAIADWIKELPAGSLKGVKTAGFDTRTSLGDVKSGFLRSMMKRFGYASKPISEGLVKKGGSPASEPEGFYVTDSEGPLKDGETERAKAWAETVIKGSGK